MKTFVVILILLVVAFAAPVSAHTTPCSSEPKAICVCAFHHDHDVVIPSYDAPEHQNGVLHRREGDEIIVTEHTDKFTTPP
jgi:hypothetical protein